MFGMQDYRASRLSQNCSVRQWMKHWTECAMYLIPYNLTNYQNKVQMKSFTIGSKHLPRVK